jgi:glutamate carboxypeptidase
MPNFPEYFESQAERMASLLQELVEIESPSDDKAALDRMGARVGELMRSSGASVEVLPRQDHGDIVLGRWGESQPSEALTILCHMDTIWPLGTLHEMPVRIMEGKLYGPGAYDMKGGIVIALSAIAGLREMGVQTCLPVRLLCTSDEETGSHASRSMIETLAAHSALVMVLEPALPGGLVKTARKGVGGFTIRARGRAAHAGADHRKGINAIEEMAHQVIAIQALTDYSLGTTVSVGEIRGGTASNVVPEECRVEVDFRVTHPGEAARLLEVINGLQPRLSGTTLEITGGLNRPPMVRDERMQRTFETAKDIAARQGIILQEGSTGGGSDGNFTAALGIPTLDGLGPGGDGGHAAHEHVLLSSLPERAALLAALLSEWAGESSRPL